MNEKTQNSPQVNQLEADNKDLVQEWAGISVEQN